VVSDKEFYVIIIGCGRLGSYLANRLSHGGHSVVVIDLDHSALEALSADYSGFRVEGDATEIDLLKHAKINKADFFIATTGDDNVNLMVAQIAKKLFQVPRVMARVFQPKREKTYLDLGIETVCPTSIAADVLLKSIESS
jgi:trk system potassium uptake protein TrkA